MRRSLPLSDDRMSDKFEGPYDVAWLVRTLGSTPRTDISGNVEGLGLTYGQVVETLYRLTEEGHVDSEFMLQSLPAQERLLEMTEVRGIETVKQRFQEGFFLLSEEVNPTLRCKAL